MLVKTSDIKPNPKNPRVIRDDKFRKLVQSITDFPQMLEKRPMICVTDADGKYVVLGGNMRLRACQEINMKEVPVMLADDWTEAQRSEFIIKDNVGFGEWDWDSLANEWPQEKLEEWGLDIPGIDEPEGEDSDQDSSGSFPLAIILTAWEYKKWQQMKKENGHKTDTEAFREIANI